MQHFLNCKDRLSASLNNDIRRYFARSSEPSSPDRSKSIDELSPDGSKSQDGLTLDREEFENSSVVFHQSPPSPTGINNSFGIKKVVKDMYDPTDYISKIPIDIGLPNMLNNCYINSIVQIFLHDQGLWTALKTTFTVQTKLLFTLKNKFTGDFNESLTTQCDTSEFLAWLLDQCKEQRVLWGIDFEHCYICKECKHKEIVSIKEDCLYVYPLKESESNDDKDLIDFWKDQLLLDTMEHKCAQCSHQYAKRKVKIKSYGDHFFFIPVHMHLGFKVPEYLVMNPTTEQNFDVAGFVVHIGQQGYGHYVTYIKSNENDWQCFSDLNIKEVELETVNNYFSGCQPQYHSIKVIWYKKS